MAEVTVAPTQSPALTPGERERVYRRNFPLFLADFVLFSIAFNLIGATTVIPDFVRKLTDAEIVIALSSQMFEVGWLLPQLLVARTLLGVDRKKWWFIGPNIPVRTLILILAGLIVVFGPDRRQEILIAFLALYGLAALGDGLVGVPWIDLAGSSLDDRRRARLFGLGNALVGVMVLGVAPVIRVILGDSGPDFPNNYALLFFLAGLVFLITVPVMVFVQELPGGEAQDRVPPLREYLPDLVRVLREDGPFRAMITVRVLFTLFTLAGPFYIGFATERLDLSSKVAVPNLLLMQTLGSVGGALVFARMGEHHTLRFIRLALLIGICQPGLGLLAAVVGPAPLYPAFLVAGVLYGSLGLGFINWVIAYATPDQRPVYTGLFNSVSAVGLLVAPLAGGGIVELVGYEAVFGVALVLILAAFGVALRYLEPARAAATAPPT